MYEVISAREGGKGGEGYLESMSSSGSVDQSCSSNILRLARPSASFMLSGG